MERKIGVIMVDEKKIEETARQISEKVVDAIGFDDSKPTHLAFLDGHVDGFNAGAKWAINEFLKDLWHPAEEEPNHEAIRTYILGETKASESGALPMLLRPNTNWKEFVVSHGVTRWLYVDDLLPKKGVKNEKK